MTYLTDLCEHLTVNSLLTDELKESMDEFDRVRREINKNIYIPYGKYKGKRIEEVAKFDLKYLKWFATQANLPQENKDGINLILKKLSL